jgi:hypothetical protein
MRDDARDGSAAVPDNRQRADPHHGLHPVVLPGYRRERNHFFCIVADPKAWTELEDPQGMPARGIRATGCVGRLGQD